MRNLFDQLYRTKLQLLATAMTAVGTALLIFARWVVDVPAASWLDGVPFSELGSALFTTGLLAVAFEYINRKDGEERAKQELRQVLRDEAPAIRDAVYDGFAFNAEALNHIASPEVLDGLARNALTVQLGDRTLAEDVYADLRQQVLQAPERWRDLRVEVSLSTWNGPADLARNPMFVATVRREYRVQPATATLRLASTGDIAEYRELLLDPAIAGQWYFEPIEGLDAADKAVFELVQLTVNGVERPVRRTSRKGAQTYTVNLGEAAATSKEVTVAYTYKALVQRNGHLLYLDFPRPTKGLHVELNYGDAPIRYVNVVDFIASATQPRVQHAPATVPQRSVGIGFDGWVFPKSGVAFVWVLEEEMQVS